MILVFSLFIINGKSEMQFQDFFPVENMENNQWMSMIFLLSTPAIAIVLVILNSSNQIKSIKPLILAVLLLLPCYLLYK